MGNKDKLSYELKEVDLQLKDTEYEFQKYLASGCVCNDSVSLFVSAIRRLKHQKQSILSELRN